MSAAQPLNILRDGDVTWQKKKGVLKAALKLDFDSPEGTLGDYGDGVELAKALVGLLSYNKDVIREPAAEVLEKMVLGSAFADELLLTEIMPALMPTLVMRLTSNPLPETCEEVRLVLVRMLRPLLEVCGGRVVPYMSDFVTIITVACQEGKVSVAEMACGAARVLAKNAPMHMHLYAGPLVNALITNLGRRQNSIRIAAIEAIGDVVLPPDAPEGVEYTDCIETLESHLLGLATDGRPEVRAAVVAVVCRWLEGLRDRRSFEPKLLRVPLICVRDSFEAVRKLAQSMLDSVGERYAEDEKSIAEVTRREGGSSARGNTLENIEKFGDPFSFDAQFLPEDLADAWATNSPAHLPNLGIRHLVSRHLGILLPPVLDNLSDWQTDTRRVNAALLSTLLIYTQGNGTMHAVAILRALFDAVQDDEAPVAAAAREAAVLVGKYYDPDVYLSLLLPLLVDDAAGAPVQHRYGAFIVLSRAVRGCSVGTFVTPLPGAADGPALPSPFEQIVGALRNPAVALAEGDALPPLLLAVVTEVVAKAGGSAADYAAELVSLLLHVEVRNLAETRDAVSSTLDALASALGAGTAATLIAAHLDSLLSEATAGAAGWNRASIELRLLHVLIRRGGPAVAPHVPALASAFAGHFRPEASANLRLILCGLLCQLAGNDTLAAELCAVLPSVLLDGLVVCLKWRVGDGEPAVRAAATDVLLRIVSAACGIWTGTGPSANSPAGAFDGGDTELSGGSGGGGGGGAGGDGGVRERVAVLAPSAAAALATTVVDALAPIAFSILTDDFSAETRGLAVTLYARCFAAGAVLSEPLRLGSTGKPPAHVYDDLEADNGDRGLCYYLLRCLDDAVDAVRVSAAETLAGYVASVGTAAVDSGELAAIVSYLLLHGDDTNADVRNACGRALVAAGKVDGDYVREQVSAKSGVNRHSDMIDSVLAEL